MKVVTANIPDHMADKIEELADEHDTSRAAVLRSVIDNGLRAPKHYPEDFPITPERYKMRSAADLAKDGELPR